GLVVKTEREFRNSYPTEYSKDKFVYPNGFVKVGSDFVNLGNNPSVEAQTAYGILKADANFLEKRIAAGGFEYGLTPEFLTQLRNIENTKGKEAAYNFFTANVNLSMEDSFYESPIVDVFEDYLDDPDVTSDFISEYEFLKEIQRIRKEILKSYRDSKNVMNTNGSSMSQETQNRVKELSLLIKEKKRVLYNLMGEKPSDFDLADGLES